jgi:hypothetical protein
MRVAYGHQITSDDDPYVKIAQDTGYALSNGGSPGSTPVDFFPFRAYSLKCWYIDRLLTCLPTAVRYFPSWFPGAFYAGFAKDNKFAIEALHNYPFEEVSKQMVLFRVLCPFPTD